MTTTLRYGAVSNTPASNVVASLVAFVVFYTALAVADAYLMLKYARLGPEGYFALHRKEVSAR